MEPRLWVHQDCGVWGEHPGWVEQPFSAVGEVVSVSWVSDRGLPAWQCQPGAAPLPPRGSRGSRQVCLSAGGPGALQV